MRLSIILFVLLFAVSATGYGQSIKCGDTVYDPTEVLLQDLPGRASHVLNSRAVDFKKPAYPMNVVGKPWRGHVAFLITVNEIGKVIRVKGVVGPPEFQRIASRAIKRTRFKKLLIDCKPSKYSGTFAVNFSPD